MLCVLCTCCICVPLHVLYLQKYLGLRITIILSIQANLTFVFIGLIWLPRPALREVKRFLENCWITQNVGAGNRKTYESAARHMILELTNTRREDISYWPTVLWLYISDRKSKQSQKHFNEINRNVVDVGEHSFEILFQRVTVCSASSVSELKPWCGTNIMNCWLVGPVANLAGWCDNMLHLFNVECQGEIRSSQKEKLLQCHFITTYSTLTASGLNPNLPDKFPIPKSLRYGVNLRNEWQGKYFVPVQYYVGAECRLCMCCEWISMPVK